MNMCVSTYLSIDIYRGRHGRYRQKSARTRAARAPVRHTCNVDYIPRYVFFENAVDVFSAVQMLEIVAEASCAILGAVGMLLGSYQPQLSGATPWVAL